MVNTNIALYPCCGSFFTGVSERCNLHNHKCFRNAGIRFPVGILLKEAGQIKGDVFPYIFVALPFGNPFLLLRKVHNLGKCKSLSGYSTFCSVVSMGTIFLQIFYKGMDENPLYSGAEYSGISAGRSGAFPQ